MDHVGPYSADGLLALVVFRQFFFFFAIFHCAIAQFLPGVAR